MKEYIIKVLVVNIKKVMIAYKLLAKLRLLTLAGVENGQLVWIGTSKNWDLLPLEEESILRDSEVKHLIVRHI